MNTPVGTIMGYHAHVYYDHDSKEVAQNIRKGLEANFEVTLGRWHDVPVGPHTAAMFQVAFVPSEFDKVVPWLMLNRSGADILLHPETGNDLRDHTESAIWFGDKLDLFTDKLK